MKRIKKEYSTKYIGPLSYNKKFLPPYHYFVIRLLKYGIITEEDYDRELGRYYGYNKCCVEYFISLNKQGKNPWDFARKQYGLDSKGIHHIRCEKCRVIKKEINQNEN